MAGPWLTMAAALLGINGCEDVPGPEDEQDAAPPATNVSNPVVSPTSAPPGGSKAAALTVAADEVVYVSLAADSFPGGEVAALSNARNGARVVAALFSGGLDAVPVAASAGDVVEVDVRRRSGDLIASRTLAVPDAKKPRVVRVYPPHKKRDVVLNAPQVIFFTEPVAENTLTPGSIQLFRGTTPVAGTVRLLPGSGAMAAFVPSAALAANTQYRVVVSDAIEDLDHEALVQRATVDFTTGQSTAGPPATLRLIPSDTIRMTAATYQMTATVEDAAGNILIDQPVTWSSSDPTNLAVSSTGLLTALAEGGYVVTAQVGSVSTSVSVVVAFATAPASVTVSPSTATVAAQDTVILTARVQDASGHTLLRDVAWSTSDATAATVAAGGYTAAVIGTTAGTATITATSGGVTGTAAIAVTAPRAVASVRVAPESTSVVVQGTVHLSAALQDANGRAIYARPIAWASDDQAVATVDANGLVKGMSLGSTIVTATAEGLSDTAAITVTAIDLASVSAGGAGGEDFTCGLTTSGSAYCWGSNAYAQLGDGEIGCGPNRGCGAPMAVAGGHKFTMVAAGGAHACGVTTSGATYCWGDASSGQLGNGGVGRSNVPVAVAGGLTFTAVSAGANHTCGLTASGAAYCWGSNYAGALGSGAGIYLSWEPIKVSGGLTFAMVTAGGEHTCGLITNGQAYCWGSNVNGELGIGAAGPEDPCTDSYRIACSKLPMAVTGGLTFSWLSAGDHQSTCGVTNSGAAYCWGNNSDGELGTGSSAGPELCVHDPYPASQCSRSPVAVSGELTFTTVSAGGQHSCGVTTSGAAYCWGGNNWVGALGDGSTTERTVPVPVAGGLIFAGVSAALVHTCGSTTNGTGYCWGANWSGELGLGATSGPELCGVNLNLGCSTVPRKVTGQR